MIYADHAATTKMSETAKLAMLSAIEENWYNPSSLYTPGQQASGVLMDARVRISRCLGCLPKEIYFTSGGSEADNQAILSAAAIGKRQGKMHIISTAFEHHAVLHTLKKLEKEGFDVNENLLLKELIHQELISFIELTIKDLPVKEKERILKKYVQCKTLESIAIEENCSMPAVYYSIKIVLKKIKEVLIKNGYDIND